MPELTTRQALNERPDQQQGAQCARDQAREELGEPRVTDHEPRAGRDVDDDRPVPPERTELVGEKILPALFPMSQIIEASRPRSRPPVGRLRRWRPWRSLPMPTWTQAVPTTNATG